MAKRNLFIFSSVFVLGQKVVNVMEILSMSWKLMSVGNEIVSVFRRKEFHYSHKNNHIF